MLVDCERVKYVVVAIGYKGNIWKDTVFIDDFIEKAKAKTVSPCLKLRQVTLFNEVKVWYIPLLCAYSRSESKFLHVF